MNKKSKKEIQSVNLESDDVFWGELQKFKAVFPQFVTEGPDGSEIDFDSFKDFLDKNKSEESQSETEKYSFTWSGRKKSFASISRPSLGTLKPDIDGSVDFENTENLFLEGDNLEVLKLLQKNYRGKIKMIYIDPPYNTGKDFVYSDNFTQGKHDYYEQSGITKNGIKMETNSGDSGRYHSNWLSMMYPRLYLAKQLLSNDGVIFISIDDHEQYHLRMLMNEVFGEENFVELFSWQKTSTPPNLSKKTKKTLEYILMYQKKDSGNLIGLSKNSKSTNGLLNQSNSVKELVFPKNIVKTKLKNGVYKKGNYGTDSYNIELLKDTEVKNGFFVNDVFLRAKFKWSQEYLNQSIEDGIKIYIQTKAFSPSYEKSEYEPEKPWNLINKDFNVGTNENASVELDKLFYPNFSDKIYPKPTSLLKYLINFSLSKNHIILDFFAGSATTGHAVMDLNKSDGGNRKFILVQIPELTDEKSEAFKAGYINIADISKDRLRKAIEKENYNEGFKVFKLSQSNYNIWNDYNGDDEVELLKQAKLFIKQPLIDGYNETDVVYEIILKQGFSLNADIIQKNNVYIVSDKDRDQKIYITFAEKINEADIEKTGITSADILVCFDASLTDSQKMNFNKHYNLRVI